MKTQFQKDCQVERIKGQAFSAFIVVGLVVGLWFGGIRERIFVGIVSLFACIFIGTMYNHQAIAWRVAMRHDERAKRR